MRDLTTTFGETAGKIWRALNEKGPTNKQQLLELTNLPEEDLNAGIGWLARENKISKEGKDVYKLSDTNLTPEIGKTAGKVYKVMDIWGEVDIPILKRLVNVDEEELYSALGWLAREDKIKTDQKNRYNIKEQNNQD